MALPEDILVRPPVELAQRVALRFLDEAHACRVRLADPADGTALHDFRVAVRRMRSTLSTWRDVLVATMRKKDRRRLRDVQHATGSGRDAEVALEWLEPQIDDIPAEARPGFDWLVARLQQRLGASMATVRAAVIAAFDEAEAILRPRLESAQVELDLRPEATPDFGGAAVVALAEGLVAELLRYLAAVQSIADEDEAHEARILGKRLRYHIEPFRAHIPEARGVVRACKQLQDVLGDINDACVLRAWIRAACDAAPAEARVGIEHVLGRIAARHEALHARLESEWLADGGARLRAQVDALAAGMGHLLAPPTEIERKYVLTTAPQLPAEAESAEIEQGYLPVEGFEDRVRRTTKASGVKRVRTLKVGSGLQRFEAEHELDDETFAALWALTAGRRVCKRRHVVAVGAHVWEVDEFLDRDLWLAEVELSSADEVAELPAWLAAAGAREVTASGEYGNRRLAR